MSLGKIQKNTEKYGEGIKKYCFRIIAGGGLEPPHPAYEASILPLYYPAARAGEPFPTSSHHLKVASSFSGRTYSPH
jgi:hypothetical protein